MTQPIQRLGALALALIGTACSTAAPGDSARGFGFTHFEQPVAESARADLGRRPSAAAPTTRGLFSEDGADGDVRARTENYFAEQLDSTSAAGVTGGDNQAEPARSAPEITDRKMIYSASFSVMVTSLPEAIDGLIARTKALGGYLAKRQDATLTVRVPADRFQTLANEIPSYGRILSESMNANDVTSRHTDLSIRLENAETSRKRLIALLDKATKMEDVIKIEAALRRLTSEIEQMKGQLKLLNNQIAYSTLTVTFQANADEAKPARKRQQSRFRWINRIGIEQDLRRF